MPRKIKAEQAGRFAKGRKHRNQWPLPHVWGSGPFAERAVERWFTRRNSHDVRACETCAQEARLTRQRRLYRSRH